MAQRHSDQAQNFFKSAWNNAARGVEPSNLYDADLAEGLRLATVCLRDIYDKLEAMDRKIDALVFGMARLK